MRQISKKSAQNLVSAAYNYLLARYSFLSVDNFLIDDTSEMGECSTNDDLFLRDKTLVVSIGVGDIFDGLDFDKKYDNNDVMNVVVGMFHEVCGHCNQIVGQFEHDDVLSNVLAANHYACLASNEYYYGCNLSNYQRQPKEIAAQYAGIKQAHIFLEKCFGEEKANTYICDYVNTRINKNNEFIDGPSHGYEKVSDILDAFDKKFINSIYRPKDYRFKFENIDSNVDHYLKNLLRVFGSKTDKSFIDMKSKMAYCKNAAVQDLRFAYTHFRDKNLLQYASKNIPAFRDISDDKVVFSNEFKPKWTTRPLISTSKNRPKLENLIDLGSEDAVINISKSDWRDYEL